MNAVHITAVRPGRSTHDPNPRAKPDTDMRATRVTPGTCRRHAAARTCNGGNVRTDRGSSRPVRFSIRFLNVTCLASKGLPPGRTAPTHKEVYLCIKP